MAFWKQLILSLAAIILIGAAWYAFFPGAQDVLMRMGIDLGSDTASADTPAAGGGPGRGGFGGFGGGGRAASVVTQAAETGIINDKMSALGSGVALHSVIVMPSSSGTLKEVLVQSGATVHAGDVIARLDDGAQQIAYDKAQLALSDAQSTLDRYKQLTAASSITSAQVQTAQLAVDNAELSLRSAELDLKNRAITAPIDGKIGIIQVDAGNAVTNQTEIATIEDRTSLLVSFWVPERLMGAMSIGDTLTAVSLARPQDAITGTIEAIDNQIDTESGTFEVQAEVPNPDDELRAGMSFTVSMNFPGDSFVAINPLSIQWGSDGAYVWKAVDGTAKRADVRIVQRNTESVLVAGDVAVGDEIVTEGLEGLRDGAAIAVAGAETPDATPQGNGRGAPAPAGAVTGG